MNLKFNYCYFNSTCILLILFIFSSCKKEEQLAIDYSRLGVNEDVNIQSITFVNSTIGYSCGGIKGELGVIYKTIDGGFSWNKIYSTPTNCLYDVSFLNDTIGFACGENSLLLKTIDGGQVWVNQNSIQGKPPLNYISTLRSIYCADNSTIYVVGGKGYEVGLTYTTYDGGGFWVYNTYDTELRGVYFNDKNKGYYAGYGSVFKTVDKGGTFVPLDITGDYFVSISFPTTDIGYACGYNGGIYKTVNEGNSWDNLLKGNNDIKHNRHFNQMEFINVNEGYAVGNTGLIMFTKDGGWHWKQIKKFTDDNLYSIAIKNPQEIFVTSSSGNIYLLKP